MTTDGMLQAWNPDGLAGYEHHSKRKRGRHCSNCTNAIVRGSVEAPVVVCQRGLGRTLELVQMIRSKAPRQFRAARECDMFERAG